MLKKLLLILVLIIPASGLSMKNTDKDEKTSQVIQQIRKETREMNQLADMLEQTLINDSFQKIAALLSKPIKTNTNLSRTGLAIQLLKHSMSDELQNQETISNMTLGNEIILENILDKTMLIFEKQSKKERVHRYDLADLLKIQFTKFLLQHLITNIQDKKLSRVHNEIISIIIKLLQPLKISSAKEMYTYRLKANNILFRLWSTLAMHFSSAPAINISKDITIKRKCIKKAILESITLIEILQSKIYYKLKLKTDIIDIKTAEKLQKTISQLADFYFILQKNDIAYSLYNRATQIATSNNNVQLLDIYLKKIKILSSQNNSIAILEKSNQFAEEINKQINQNAIPAGKAAKIYDSIKEILYLYLKDSPDLFDKVMNNINQAIIANRESTDMGFKIDEIASFNTCKSSLSCEEYTQALEILKNISSRNESIRNYKNYLKGIIFCRLAHKYYVSSENLNYYPLLDKSLELVIKVIESEKQTLPEQRKYYKKCISMLQKCSTSYILSYAKTCRLVLDKYEKTTESHSAQGIVHS